MAGTDPVDTHGHDRDDAVAQEPTLDVNATPASSATYDKDDFRAFGADMVLAQSAAEVQAQIDNEVAGSGS